MTANTTVRWKMDRTSSGGASTRRASTTRPGSRSRRWPGCTVVRGQGGADPRGRRGGAGARGSTPPERGRGPSTRLHGVGDEAGGRPDRLGRQGVPRGARRTSTRGSRSPTSAGSRATSEDAVGRLVHQDPGCPPDERRSALPPRPAAQLVLPMFTHLGVEITDERPTRSPAATACASTSTTSGCVHRAPRTGEAAATVTRADCCRTPARYGLAPRSPTSSIPVSARR